MIDFGGLLTWAGILNFGFGIAILWALIKLKDNSVRTPFVFLTINILLWINGILLFKVTLWEEDFARIISKLIFIFGILLPVSFSFFVVSLCQLKNTTKGILFWVFQAIALIYICLTLGDFIENGLLKEHGRWVPTYGPLHKSLGLFVIVFSSYSFFLVAKTYFATHDNILRFQLRIFFITTLISVIGMVTTNVVIPAITGDTTYSLVGPLIPIVALVGFGLVVKNGRNLYLNQSFKKLLHEASKSSPENLISFRIILTACEQLFKKQITGVDKQIPIFVGNDTMQLSFLIETKSKRKLPKVSKEWTMGLVDAYHRLEESNRRLLFKVLKLENHFQEEQISEEQQLKIGYQFYGNEIILKNYQEQIEQNLLDSYQSYGQRILCFDGNFFQQLQEVKNIADAGNVFLIRGEAGSGKATLAKIIQHFNAPNETLLELHPYELSMNEHLLTDSRFQKADAVLIRHFDELDSSLVTVCHYLESLVRKGKRVLLTSKPSFSLSRADIPERLGYYLSPVEIETIPLKERTDDLFYYTLMHIAALANAFQKPFDAVSKTFLTWVEKESWPGNFIQLHAFLRKQVVAGRPPLLTKKGRAIEFSKSNSAISPLERAERDVIVTFLKKNKLNKSRTARDLKVTINTLNAKMEKYSVVLEDLDLQKA